MEQDLPIITRRGLRIRSDSGINPIVKRACLKFGKWLRANMEFPIRVVVYLKKSRHILTRKKEFVSATFLGPYDKNEEPYIRIATGDDDEMYDEYNNFMVKPYLCSMGHELIHYQQWLEDRPYSEEEAETKGEQLVNDYIDALCEEIYKLQETPTEDVLAQLEDLFEIVPGDNQLCIIDALSSFSNIPRAKKWLIELAKNKNVHFRYYSMCSLSYFSGNDVNQAVIAGLKDEEEMVRIFAAQALLDVGTEMDIPILIEALSDKNELVRGYAARSLSTLGNKSHMPILKEKLKMEKMDATKLRLYVALYHLGESETLPLIINFLDHSNSKIRIPTIDYLIEITDDHNLNLIQSALRKSLEQEQNEEVRDVLSEALEEISQITFDS